MSTQFCVYLQYIPGHPASGLCSGRGRINTARVEREEAGRQPVLRETVAEADRRVGTAPSYKLPKIRQTVVVQGNIKSCLPSSRHYLVCQLCPTVSKDRVCQRTGRL